MKDAYVVTNFCTVYKHASEDDDDVPQNKHSLDTHKREAQVLRGGIGRMQRNVTLRKELKMDMEKGKQGTL